MLVTNLNHVEERISHSHHFTKYVSHMENPWLNIMVTYREPWNHPGVHHGTTHHNRCGSPPQRQVSDSEWMDQGHARAEGGTSAAGRIGATREAMLVDGFVDGLLMVKVG